MAVIPNPGGGGGGGGGGPVTQATVPWIVDDGHPDPQLDALTDAELRAAEVEVVEGFLRDLRDHRRVPLIPFSTIVTSGSVATILTPAAGMAIEIWKFGWTPRRTQTDDGNICALQWANTGSGIQVIWSAVAAQMTHVWLGDVDRALQFDPANAEEVTVNVWYREV